MSEQNKDPRNTGHGWVTEQPDGMRARCGGPGLCATCKAEKEAAKPPALGGEPEVIYMLRNKELNTSWRHADKVAFDCAAGLAKYDRRELVDRAHVTALNTQLTTANAAYQDQVEEVSELHAEVERLRAELEVTGKLYEEGCQATYDFDAMQQHIDDLRGMLRIAWGSDDIPAEDCRRIDAALAEGKEHE